MSGDSTFDAVFWLSLSGGIIGFLGILLKQCFKSKCTSLQILWGCITIKRDVEAEEHIHDVDVEHGIINNQSSRNNASIQPSNNNRIGSHQ